MADQLRAALKQKKVSQRELSRRLAGTASADSKEAKSKRRWLGKILQHKEKGAVRHPEPESMAEVETALGLPRGYFKIPKRPRVAEAMEAEQSNAVLLQRLEERLTADLVAQRKDLAAAIRRIRALERRALAGEQPASETDG